MSLAESTNSQRRVQAVLFDFDGTLADTTELIMESFRYSTRRVLGRALSDEELRKNIGIPLDTQMEIFSPDRGEELSRVYREHNLTIHDSLIKEFPGTKEVLETLKGENLPMAIITSKMHHMAMRAVNLFDMSQYFEFLIGSDDVELHKPNPFPLICAAERLDIPIENCIYIGDSPHDMNAAISAGAISVAALWGAFEEEVVLGPNPQYALESIGELPELIEKIEKT